MTHEKGLTQDALAALNTAIEQGQVKDAAKAVRAALEAGADPEAVLREVMIPAMDEVGRLYECGDYFLPEMLVCARAMKEALAILRPRLVATDVKPAGTVVAGTVRGDLHDIGKNLVCAMLEGAGFEVRDLGVDVAPERFVETVRGGGANLLALSALLTTTLPNMKVTIDRLKAEGLRERVGVMVGGAPVSERLAEEIGADGYAEDAAGAVALARRLVGAGVEHGRTP